IRSAAEYLKLIAGDDPRIQRAQGILDRQSTHMSKLLDGLLDVSRIIRGVIKIEKEIIDFSKICRAAVSDVRERGSAEEIVLRADIPDEPVYIEADRVRLVQIVDNLLSNAVKYTRPGDHVWLALSRDAENATLL